MSLKSKNSKIENIFLRNLTIKRIFIFLACGILISSFSRVFALVSTPFIFSLKDSLLFTLLGLLFSELLLGAIERKFKDFKKNFFLLALLGLQIAALLIFYTVTSSWIAVASSFLLGLIAGNWTTRMTLKSEAALKRFNTLRKFSILNFAEGSAIITISVLLLQLKIY